MLRRLVGLAVVALLMVFAFHLVATSAPTHRTDARPAAAVPKAPTTATKPAATQPTTSARYCFAGKQAVPCGSSVTYCFVNGRATPCRPAGVHRAVCSMLRLKHGEGGC